jgi:hypothetical protein
MEATSLEASSGAKMGGSKQVVDSRLAGDMDATAAKRASKQAKAPLASRDVTRGSKQAKGGGAKRGRKRAMAPLASRDVKRGSKQAKGGGAKRDRERAKKVERAQNVDSSEEEDMERAKKVERAQNVDSSEEEDMEAAAAKGGSKQIIPYDHAYAQVAIGRAAVTESAFIPLGSPECEGHTHRTSCGICQAPLVNSDYEAGQLSEHLCGICSTRMDTCPVRFCCPFGHSVWACYGCSRGVIGGRFAMPSTASRNGQVESRLWIEWEAGAREQTLQLCLREGPSTLSRESFLHYLSPAQHHLQSNVWLFRLLRCRLMVGDVVRGDGRDEG